MYKKIEACPVCESKAFTNSSICKDHSVSGESFALVRCNQCGFVFTNPRPEESELGRYYQSEDYVSHQNKANNPINFVYKLVRSKTLKDKEQLLSKYTDTGRLLDVGCGTGHFAVHAQRKGWSVTAVEKDKQARSIAKASLRSEVLDDLAQIPAKPKYNAITLWHVLEHLPDLNGTITRLRSLLKKEGRLFVAVPNKNSWDAQHYKEYWAAYDVPRHLYHFTQDTMRTLLKKHKLKIEAVVPMPFDAYYVAMLSEKYKTGSNNYLTAFTNGRKSNQWAKTNHNDYSSLIYVIKK